MLLVCFCFHDFLLTLFACDFWKIDVYLFPTVLLEKKGTIVLEGVDTSLMAKVTPAKLNHSVFNSGLLATLIGTLGRVLADFFITMGALLDVFVLIDFVSAIYFPLLVRAYFPVLCCCCFFPSHVQQLFIRSTHARTYTHTHTQVLAIGAYFLVLKYFHHFLVT